ncbi:ABC transporter permease [Embleya sp. NPDC050493]|uniref:ABC transporter permease n=1 Tax=Embleya sp. NPDC050493 TaxID=3363989 RepID=UPI003790EA71
MSSVASEPDQRTPQVSDAPVLGTATAGHTRTIRVMWYREVLRLRRTPVRVVFALMSPLLFLLVLGTGLTSAMESAGDDADYRVYLVPGVLLMAIQVPAVNTGVSIVWDRQAGFLREMLVAPVRRSALLTGICLGGTTVAVLHGILMLVFTASMGISVRPHLLALVLLELVVIAFTLTAGGILAAVCLERAETFQAVVGIALMPLLFLSGALFPVSGLPGWLNGAVLANPMSYGVDAMRRTLPTGNFENVAESGPHWWGWQPPVVLEIAGLALLACLTLTIAARRFSRIE